MIASRIGNYRFYIKILIFPIPISHTLFVLITYY